MIKILFYSLLVQITNCRNLICLLSGHCVYIDFNVIGACIEITLKISFDTMNIDNCFEHRENCINLITKFFAAEQQ